jgi:hypothetical protein
MLIFEITIKTKYRCWFLKCNDFRNQHFFYKSIKMNNTDIIDRTISFVKEKLKHAEGGHDWFHIERVYVADCKEEVCNETIVKLAAPRYSRQ